MLYECACGVISIDRQCHDCQAVRNTIKARRIRSYNYRARNPREMR